jgi:phosphoglycolate phosphatase
MEVILFDIDGTLLASGGAGKLALETAFTEDFGLELRFQVPYSGRTDRAIVRELFQAHAVAPTPGNFEKLVAGYLQRLPACLGRMQGRVLPGIADLLEDLREREQVAVGLLTGNLRAGAKVKLGHFGLYEHFSFGGFGDHHFDRDDVAREALAAVHAHVHPEVTPDRIWVIGDTPLDVRCARAIGAKVVAVATGSHTLDELTASAPDLVVKDLTDPGPFLNLWAKIR